MIRQLFGTDGIRGVAGEAPLDPATVFAVGVALGRWISNNHLDAEVVIGTDTRESGQWIAEHVAGGLATLQVRARFAGLTTTPGVAYLARTGAFAAGVMISASHNPYQDNGIKVLDHAGFKLPDAQEHAIEQEVFAALEAGLELKPSPLSPDDSLDRLYVDYLASTFPARLDGMRIVVDAANGSASHIGPALFESLGAQVTSIGSSPNGRNINLDCGSLHLDRLRKHVADSGADIGIAFDGDADRALFVTQSGQLVDGDAVMLITAEFLHSRDRLAEDDGAPVVVSTVMSNLGLERALEERGIAMVRTPVGDKYVLAEMLQRGARLGGEQSGHVIFRDYATTGDGLLTALRVLEVVQATGKSLDQLRGGMTVYPQVLLNLRVKRRKPLDQLPLLQQAIRAAELEFGNSGRVLVRFSGTEPLVRVMVEGADAALVESAAKRIAQVAREELGE